jgi:hypothetical protein
VVRLARDDAMGWALLSLGLAIVVLPPRPVVRRAWQPLALCAGLALVYLVVLITSRDLTWQVETVHDRLVLQLWPLALLGLATCRVRRA